MSDAKPAPEPSWGALIEEESDEFALLVDRDATVRWIDARAERCFGACGGTSVDALALEGSVEKLRGLLEAGAIGVARGWELLLRVGGVGRTVRVSARPVDGAVLLVGAVMAAGYARALEQLTETLGAVAALQRETERQGHALRAANVALGRSAQRESLLSAVGVELARRRPLGERVEAVLRLTVPQRADWAIVDVLGSARGRLAAVHAQPERDAALREPVWSPHDGTSAALGGSRSSLAVGPDALRDFASDRTLLAWFARVGTSSLICAPLVARGQTLGLLMLGGGAAGRGLERSDLTLADDLAHRLALAVDNARHLEEAHRSTRVRDGFIADISRDLRRPVVALLGALPRLRADPNSTETLDEITSLIYAQARVLEDLLDLSAALRGRLALELRTLDLRETVHEACAGQRGAARIDEDLGDAPALLEHDAARLRDALGVALSSLEGARDDDRVRVTLRATPAGALLRFEAPGRARECAALLAALSQGDLSQADPSQADPSQARPLGLGLTLTRSVLALHGATVRGSRAGTPSCEVEVSLPTRAPLDGRTLERALVNAVGR